MRLVFGSLLAFVSAVVAGITAPLLAALVAGRLDLCRNLPGQTFFFVWSVRSDSSLKGILWEILAALARAIGAFGAARLALALFGARPTIFFAAVLLVWLVGWEVWNLKLRRRAPIPVPSEIRSLQTFQATARVFASIAIAPLFLQL
jgi:hypothetical protein